MGAKTEVGGTISGMFHFSIGEFLEKKGQFY